MGKLLMEVLTILLDHTIQKQDYLLLSHLNKNKYTMEQKELTIKEAFLAMVLYLEDINSTIESDDIYMLLGDLLFGLDGGTMDPASWHEWMNAVKKVKNTPLKDLIEHNTIKYS